MTFDIKKHLKLEIILVIISMIVMVTIAYDMHLFIKIFGVCCFIGLFNTIYLFIKLIEQNKYNMGLLLIIFLISFGLQWLLFSLLAIPIIIFESISVVSNKMYIGGDSNFMNQELKREKNMVYLNEKEKDLFNTFMIKVKKVNFIKWIIILIGGIFIILMQSTMKGVLALFLSLIIVVLLAVVYFIIRMKIFTLANNDLSLKFLNDCDSVSYYHVSKSLSYKYPNNFILLESYFIATRLDNNNYDELKELIEKHKSYHKHSFYLKAILDTYGVGENNDNFDKFYEKAISENERLFNKYKDVRWENNIKYLNAEKLQLEGKLEESLKVLNTIENLELKFEKVNYAYIKGKYLMSLNRVEEAKQNFKFVIDNGNTLRFCYKAKEYMNQLDNFK